MSERIKQPEVCPVKWYRYSQLCIHSPELAPVYADIYCPGGEDCPEGPVTVITATKSKFVGEYTKTERVCGSIEPLVSLEQQRTK